ncbi:MAG: LVIVD repeat-containing protein [Actinomycetota bacterium]|nr:hypothetical protein [Actinomycetota bacterium]
MRRRLLLALIALLLAGSSAIASPSSRLAPKVDAPDEPLSSPNVSLVAHFPDPGATGGRFVGKYFYMTSSGPALIAPGPTGGLRIFDASNPELPVLVGFLPLPHYENEDVDVAPERHLVLISMDKQSSNPSIAGALFIVDVMNPALPALRSVVQYPATVGEVDDPSPTSVTHKKYMGGPGHIANCILQCRFAYVTGARNGTIFVIDLRNVDAPAIMGTFKTPAAKANPVFTQPAVHDVNVDPQGYVWMTGSGGTAMYAPVKNPLRPKLLAWVSPRDNVRYDQFIHHNSLRLNKDTVLVTEEDWEQPQCGRDEDIKAADKTIIGKGEQGSFQAWHIAAPKLTPLGTWQTELGDYLDGGAAVTIVCSSHWFSFNRSKVVAVGWYNQGLRFLDVSNPRHIRQVGYWMGPMTTASAGLFVPGRGDIAYSVDYTRGLDVLKIADGGRNAITVRAPVRAEWFTDYAGVRFAQALRPDDAFGWACARPAA